MAALVAASGSDGAPKSPEDIYFDRLKEVQERTGALGSTLVVGLGSESDDEDEDEDDDEDEEEEEEEEPKKKAKTEKKVKKVYTQEEIDRLRHIIITQNRENMINVGTNFVTCGQARDGMIMMNTSHGNMVISELAAKVRKAMRKEALSDRFDALFGLTFALKEYDICLNDNEMGGPGEELMYSLKKLGLAWREVLAHTDAELGIDTEFTRPGIAAFLKSFKELIDELSDSHGCTYKFPWSEEADTKDDDDDDDEEDEDEEEEDDDDDEGEFEDDEFSDEDDYDDDDEDDGLGDMDPAILRDMMRTVDPILIQTMFPRNLVRRMQQAMAEGPVVEELDDDEDEEEGAGGARNGAQGERKTGRR